MHKSYLGFSSNTLYAKIKRIYTKKDEMFQALNQRRGVWHHCYLNLEEAEEQFTFRRLHTPCSSLQSKVAIRERERDTRRQRAAAAARLEARLPNPSSELRPC
jgi:hypothetical protein